MVVKLPQAQCHKRSYDCKYGSEVASSSMAKDKLNCEYYSEAT